MISSYKCNFTRIFHIRNYQQIILHSFEKNSSNLHKFWELILAKGEVQPASMTFLQVLDCCLAIDESAFVVAVQS